MSRTFLFVSLALVLGLAAGLALPEVRAQAAPQASSLCIGFDTSNQIPGKTAEMMQEWMNQQIASNRTRFTTTPSGKGVVLCAW